MNRNKLRQDLVRHEGIRLKPYKDTVGKLTIGVGRNLDDRGITRKEAFFLLDNDIEEILESAWKKIPTYNDHNEVRQRVLVNMYFNMETRLLGFKKMFAALEKKDYEAAADEMLDSKWAKQVGNRSVQLAEMMRNGNDVGIRYEGNGPGEYNIG